MTRETRTWVQLIALSTVSTVLSALDVDREILAFPILLVAALKAHAILGSYLRLSSAQSWLRGFDLGLTCFALICIILVVSG